MRFISFFSVLIVILSCSAAVAESKCNNNSDYYYDITENSCFCKPGYYGRPCAAGSNSGCGNPGSYPCMACPSGGKSDGGPGATSPEDCYSGIRSECRSVDSNGTGSGRPYFRQTGGGQPSQGYWPDDLTGVYDRCRVLDSLKTCDAGYYRPNVGAVKCSAVGSGYYSPDGLLTRTECPTNDRADAGDGQWSISSVSQYAAAVTDCLLIMNPSRSDSTGSYTISPSSCRYQ